MKAIGRRHLWWPKLDADIEETARCCNQCVKTRSAPPTAPLHPWTFPNRPWQRVHADFASVDGKHYLVVVDAYSKWPLALCQLPQLQPLPMRYEQYSPSMVCQNL